MKVICVDDEKNILQYHRMLLSRMEEVSEVNAFGSPKRCLDFLRNNRDVSVAFLDINMPGTDGLTLAKSVKELLPDIKIIFVTGYPEYKSQAIEGQASGYLIKPASESEIRKELLYALQDDKEPAADRLKVTCFGNFEVFYKGSPVVFGLTKSKEVFAYLVDRKGSGASAAEICAVVWEESQSEEKAKGYFRRCWKDIKDTLEAIGQGKAMVKSWNSYSINADEIWCDAYEFEKGNVAEVNAFHGEYMNQYSWGEFNLSRFTGRE